MIFIIGNSRSGTTLLARILNQHSKVWILKETHFMEEFSNRVADYKLKNTPITFFEEIQKMFCIQKYSYYNRKFKLGTFTQKTDNFLSKITDQKIDFFEINRHFFFQICNEKQKEIPGDQTPRHIFYIPELTEAYPEAKFIHIYRDPRAVLLSQKKKWKASAKLNTPFYEIIRTLMNYHPITNALLWRKGIRSILRTYKNRESYCIINISFEELSDKPKETLQKICDFLSINYEEQMPNVRVEASSNLKEEGRVGISKTIPFAWSKALSETEKYICEHICKKEMRIFNYEMTKPEPNISSLIFYLTIFVPQLIFTVFLNISRMGNIVQFISRRL